MRRAAAEPPASRHPAAQHLVDPVIARTLPESVRRAVRETVLAVGVRRATLTDVARRAGVSRMTLYRLVPDVESLLLESLTTELTEVLVAAQAAVSPTANGRERLVATGVEVARRLPEDPLVRKLLEVDPELLLPYLTDRLGATQRIALQRLRDSVVTGQRDGSVRTGDPELMAYGLLSVLTPSVVSARVDVGLDRADVLSELGRGLDGWLRP